MKRSKLSWRWRIPFKGRLAWPSSRPCARSCSCPGRTRQDLPSPDTDHWRPLFKIGIIIWQGLSWSTYCRKEQAAAFRYQGALWQQKVPNQRSLNMITSLALSKKYSSPQPCLHRSLCATTVNQHPNHIKKTRLYLFTNSKALLYPTPASDKSRSKNLL